MTFFKFAFSRFSHKPAPVVVTNMSIDSWCHQLRTHPTRLIRKIDMCTALSAGQDAWGTPVDKTHLHTLLRVCLVPTSCHPNDPEDVFFVERVLSTSGAYHSVTPISEAVSTGGTLFHPEVHDRICVISDGPWTTRVRQLAVERTLSFGSDPSGPYLTLAQLAQILELVSRVTTFICAGGDCKFQSRSFAFTCLAALTPNLPPSTSERKGVDMNTAYESASADDSVFELGAETFLGQVPWLARDPESTQAVKLMVALREAPPERVLAGLCY